MSSPGKTKTKIHIMMEHGGAGLIVWHVARWVFKITRQRTCRSSWRSLSFPFFPFAKTKTRCTLEKGCDYVYLKPTEFLFSHGTLTSQTRTSLLQICPQLRHHSVAALKTSRSWKPITHAAVASSILNRLTTTQSWLVFIALELIVRCMFLITTIIK